MGPQSSGSPMMSYTLGVSMDLRGDELVRIPNCNCLMSLPGLWLRFYSTGVTEMATVREGSR
jgi:hypothetical protein